jgi:DNA-binding beta-propeller fold protein YncE
MHGHYCVVVDDKNKSIKVVDTKQKQVTSQIGIEAKYIWAMTPVSDNQVVVSVSLSDGKNQIQFFSVSTSGVIQSTNQVNNADGYYTDMVHCKGNIYGVRSFQNKIGIINMTGKIIRRIQTDDKGAAVFGILEGIALSPDGQTLYVTDSTQHSVISLTLDGKVKVIYTDKDLEGRPCGITADKYGYVYVRNRGTKNIHQLTADLNKVQVLIDDVTGNHITYSSTENKLYISCNNNINEYSLDFK